MRIQFFVTLFLAFSINAIEIINAQPFVHPGLLQSRQDIDRMKKGVAEKQEPLYAGYEVFQQNAQSQYTYKMQGPMASVGRNPTVGQGAYDADANAAYQNAIMWCITGEPLYAAKAIEIVNAWSSVLKSITGRDAVLMAGLGPFKMVNAAEILRYTHTGWSASDIQQTEKHFKEVVYPVLKDFAPFANGNWDGAAIKTVMAIGIFCNDRSMFEHALRYYVDGAGDGRLTHYIINEEGQCQESGRDQQHTQLGIGLLGDCCEMAWHQGLDLYGYANNRLLKGFEYTAKYNLGQEVSFSSTMDRTGKYTHKAISEDGRGRLRPVYEQIYNHYVNRMGIAAPYTQQAAEKIRPEKQGQPGADHPGFGTLLYTRSSDNSVAEKRNDAPASPAAIIATGESDHVDLTWVASVGAKSYTIKRAATTGGSYTTIAKNITQLNYTDKKVKPGTLYYYTISATSANGESPDAFKVAVSTGLLSLWKHQDIGKVAISGNTQYNGNQFTIDGGGAQMDSIHDAFQFAYIPLIGDGSITARYVPQISSQFSKMGLMIREGLTNDAASVSLIIYPGKTGQVEAPAWQASLLSRDKPGAKTVVRSRGAGIATPAVTYGRLTGYYWLRLQRKGTTFTGFTSYDGKEWTEVGSAVIPLKKNLLAGLPVSSGIPAITTRIVFDNVTITGQKGELKRGK